MAEFPALPLFTDAYIADTDHLSDSETGVYFRLLMLMWRSPQCRIPNDVSWIARRLRKTPEQVVEYVMPIINEFCQQDGNWLSQKRLRREWEWCEIKRRQSAYAANSRWNKGKDISKRNAEVNGARITESHSPRNPPYPTLPYPLKESIEQGSKEGSGDKPNGRTGGGDFDIFYLAYPKHIGRKAAEKAFQKAIKETSIAAMLAAIEKQKAGWTDPKFIPHPATWLNQGRWADEVKEGGFQWNGIEGVI